MMTSTVNTPTGAATAATETEIVLHWIDPKDGIADVGIIANGGTWLIRHWDEFQHRLVEDARNIILPETADPAALTAWVTAQLGRPVTLTQDRPGRRWLPARLRLCGVGICYTITPADPR